MEKKEMSKIRKVTQSIIILIIALFLIVGLWSCEKEELNITYIIRWKVANTTINEIGYAYSRDEIVHGIVVNSGEIRTNTIENVSYNEKLKNLCGIEGVVSVISATNNITGKTINKTIDYNDSLICNF